MMTTKKQLPSSFTQFLKEARDGDEHAQHQVWEMAYLELKRVAQRLIHNEWHESPISATVLVHESYLRLQELLPDRALNKTHFLAFACKAMRQILVEQARYRNAQKRNNGQIELTLEDGAMVQSSAETVLAVEQALTHLHQIEPRLVQVIECRYYGGLSNQEAAEVLGLSRRSIERDWVRAKSLLLKLLAECHG
ncbi:MAG: sigma-70 family RNA polymerase sigma factor [Acidobacteria bacterium]|nr:sigma-70 family RNA polymerase sigma factor [Acidobacteriota bacterium]